MSSVMTRRRLITSTSATALLGSSRASAADVRVLQIGQGGSMTTPLGVACRRIAEAVAAHPALKDVIKIEVHDDASIGDDLNMLKNCMAGTLDMAVVGTTVMSKFVPTVGLLDAPFVFKDARAARATLDGEVGATLIQELKAKDIHILAWAENGVRHMTANAAIRRPSDLAGLKLRVPQSEVMLSTFRSLGADANALPLPSLYEALRIGQFDAQENPIGLIEAFRFNEVQKVLSLTSHIYSGGGVIVSADVIEDLTPQQLAALQTCAQQGCEASRNKASEAQTNGLARLRKLGMTVVEDIDTAAFLAASKPILSIIGKAYGPEMMARLITAGAA